jgi:hypothetical protein
MVDVSYLNIALLVEQGPAERGRELDVSPLLVALEVRRLVELRREIQNVYGRANLANKQVSIFTLSCN